MAFNLSGAITGGAQTGLTSPTVTWTVATAPVPNARRFTATTLGGTQTGAHTHEIARPFDLTVFQPSVYRQLGTPNPVTGVIQQVPYNVHTIVVRYGAAYAANQPVKNAITEITVKVPAGAESYDSVGIATMLSAAIGALSNQSSGFGDTVRNGTL